MTSLNLEYDIIVCRGKKIDHVLFPELLLPRKLLLYISKLLLKENSSIIAGIEHKTHTLADNESHPSFNGILTDQLLCVLCVQIDDYVQQIAVGQDKTIPAQAEEEELFKVGGKYLRAFDNNKYLINHGGVYFSGLICNDLLDINNRAN